MNHNGARDYFLAAFDGVWTTLKGMMVTLKYLNIFREKPVTLCYPDELPDIQPGFRGKHVYVKETCIACRMCERACPVSCIAMDIEGKGKSAIVHSYKVDYSKCLFCNLCSEACPVDCLWLGTEYDLTQYSRAACTMEMIDPANADLRMPEKTKVAKPPKAKPAPKPEAKPAAAATETKPEGQGGQSA